MKIEITQAHDGVIIVDTVIGLRGGQGVETATQTQIPVEVDRMDFEFQDGTYHVTDIGNSTLTPTVKNDVRGFNFDETAKTIQVIGSDGQSVVYSTSTDNRLVQVRVNFNTASITVYE